MAGAKSQAKKKAAGKGREERLRARTRRPKAAKTAAKAAPRAKPELKAVEGRPGGQGRRPVARRSQGRQASPPPRAAPFPDGFRAQHLHQVALLATDLDAAVTFYRDVARPPFMARYDPPGLAFFNLGNGVRLILSATSSTATLYFYVKDLAASFPRSPSAASRSCTSRR